MKQTTLSNLRKLQASQ